MEEFPGRGVLVDNYGLSDLSSDSIHIDHHQEMEDDTRKYVLAKEFAKICFRPQKKADMRL